MTNRSGLLPKNTLKAAVGKICQLQIQKKTLDENSRDQSPGNPRPTKGVENYCSSFGVFKTKITKRPV